MNFDPQIAMNYTAAIARPRRVGTGGDDEVAAEITEQLRGWGYEVERQAFTFSAAPLAFLKLVMLVAIGVVLMMLLAHEHFSSIADVAALGLIALALLFMPLNRRVQSAAWSRMDAA